MRPDIAPNHINRIKALIRRCFYDGLQFFDVKSNFAAITGDPLNTGKGGSGIKIKAEFSDAPFITGSVGMIRDQKKPNSADSQFFIALKPLPISLVNIQIGQPSLVAWTKSKNCQLEGRPKIPSA